MNKIAVAIIVVILLVVYGVLALDYMKQGPEQDRLLSDIEEIDQSLQELSQPPLSDFEGLASVQADLVAEQGVIPREINSSDVVEEIFILAQAAGVKAIPLVTEPWTEERVGGGTYRIFRISIGVEGTFTQVSNFISRLENGVTCTLSVEELSMAVDGEEGDISSDGTTPVVAELGLIVLAQSLTN